jgi:hypothetical protein
MTSNPNKSAPETAAVSGPARYRLHLVAKAICTAFVLSLAVTTILTSHLFG